MKKDKNMGKSKNIEKVDLKKNTNFMDELKKNVNQIEEEELSKKIEEFYKSNNYENGKNVNSREFISNLFSKSLYAELFFAWSKDCDDEISVENAKYFRDELLLRGNKDDKNFNFKSMRVSKNFLVAFTGNVTSHSINRLDLSDNLITDVCMHNIRSLISNKKVMYLNLSSNMISTEGLKIIHSEIINSENLSYLNVKYFLFYLAWCM